MTSRKNKSKVIFDLARVREQRAAGVAADVIAAEYGCSVNTVYNFCKQHGLPNIRHQYGPATIDAVRDLTAKGRSAAKIGAQLGLKACAITKIRERNNISRPPSCVDRLDLNEVLSLVEQGWTYAAIGHMMGCTAQNISMIMIKSGHRTRPHKKRPARAILAKCLHMSLAEIATKYGVSDNTVRRWLESYDLALIKEPSKTFKLYGPPPKRKRHSESAVFSASPRAIKRALAQVAR